MDAVHRLDVDRGLEAEPLRYSRAPPRGGRTEEGPLGLESRVGWDGGLAPARRTAC